MRRGLSSGTLARPSGRAQFLPLAFLALLGLLAMHGTPMMVTPDLTAAEVSHGSAADQAIARADAVPHAMPSGASTARRDEQKATPGTARANVSSGGSDYPMPGEHMTAPCLADTARAYSHAVALPGIPSQPSYAPEGARTVVVTVTARSDRSPPDLRELCISRT